MQKTYELGLYEKAMPNTLSLMEKLECARECGFDFVELSIDESDEKLMRLDMSIDKRKDILHGMADANMFFRSMCLSGHRKYPFGSLEPATREKSMDIMKKAVDLSAEFGIRIIQLAGYDVYYETGNEKTREFFTENLMKAVEYASKAGVLMGFETMETPFMDTVEKAMEFVSLVSSPYLGVYPDLGNLTNAEKIYKTSVLNDLEKGRSHLIAMHLKETVPGKYREIPFGTGHVNFKAGIEKAMSLGVHRFVCEMWYVGQEEWKAAIKAAASFLQKFLNA